MPKQLIDETKIRMEKTIHALHQDFKGIRTGRASTSLLDHVIIEVYGSKMPLNQLATVNVPEPRTLSVQVWDQSNIHAVEKGIANAGLGLNPMANGNVIRIPLPDLSEERRKELVKIVHQYAEKARISIRNTRRTAIDSLKKMEKNSEISQDEQHKFSDDIQKMTDTFIHEIDEALTVKEKDIMVV